MAHNTAYTPAMADSIAGMDATAMRALVQSWVAEALAMPAGDPERARLLETAQGAHWLGSYLEAQDEGEADEARADSALEAAARGEPLPENESLDLQALVSQALQDNGAAVRHLLRNSSGDILGLLDRNRGVLHRLIRDASDTITSIAEEPYDN